MCVASFPSKLLAGVHNSAAVVVCTLHRTGTTLVEGCRPPPPPQTLLRFDVCRCRMALMMWDEMSPASGEPRTYP